MIIPRRGVLFIPVLILCSSLIISCRDNSTSGTSTQAATSERPTPISTAQLVDGRIISAIGYQADLPNGWDLKSGFVQAPDFRTDALFAPTSSDPDRAKTNINVTCQLLNEDDLVTTKEAAEARQRAISSLGALAPRLDVITVAAREAYRLSYAQSLTTDQGDISVVKYEVLQRRDECLWLVTLTFLPADQAEALMQFDAFLSSLTFGA